MATLYRSLQAYDDEIEALEKAIKMSPGAQRLLEACEKKGHSELAVVIRVAIQTSADRGVLLAGEVNKDRDPARGLLASR